jgi:hypothetical protein
VYSNQQAQMPGACSRWAAGNDNSIPFVPGGMLGLRHAPAVRECLSAFIGKYEGGLFFAPAFQLHREGVQGGIAVRAGNALGQMGLDVVQNCAGVDTMREAVIHGAIPARTFDQVADFKIEPPFIIRFAMVHIYYDASNNFTLDSKCLWMPSLRGHDETGDFL